MALEFYGSSAARPGRETKCGRERSNGAMERPQKLPEERRQNIEQRLRIAVRRAHDPMFAILRNPAPATPSPAAARSRPS
jgi:hypothetical protein